MTEGHIQGKDRKNWKDHVRLFCTILIQVGSDRKVSSEKLQIQWQLMQGSFAFPAQRSVAGFKQMLMKDAQGSPKLGSVCWEVTSPSLGTPGGGQVHAAPSLARHPSLCQAAHSWQSLIMGRGRAMLPAALACLLAWSRLRRRCGHSVPQRGGTRMLHLQPDAGCCRLNHQ